MPWCRALQAQKYSGWLASTQQNPAESSTAILVQSSCRLQPIFALRICSCWSFHSGRGSSNFGECCCCRWNLFRSLELTCYTGESYDVARYSLSGWSNRISKDSFLSPSDKKVVQMNVLIAWWVFLVGCIDSARWSIPQHVGVPFLLSWELTFFFSITWDLGTWINFEVEAWNKQNTSAAPFDLWRYLFQATCVCSRREQATMPGTRGHASAPAPSTGCETEAGRHETSMLDWY